MSRVLNLARNMALKSRSKFRLGAVLVKKNRVVSAGFNSMLKTHPLQQKFNDGKYTIGIHAELHACLGVSAKDLEDSEIYVVRLRRDGQFALAKPCQICEKFLYSVGVRCAHYTVNENEISKLEF